MNYSFSGNMAYPIKDEKRWCKNHPTSVWGKTKDGRWYLRCYRGFTKNEQCEAVTEGGDRDGTR